MLSTQDSAQIEAFSRWLAERNEHLLVHLRIRKNSRWAPGGLNKRCRGLEEVLNSYVWDRKNWEETKQEIDAYRKRFSDAFILSDKSRENRLFDTCMKIVSWGGGQRNKNRGAAQFLKKLKKERRLGNYLDACQADLSLNSTLEFSHVELMNSMLTKVHAFCATDGLPIYDSRVAAAIASLVEMYRLETPQPWTEVPQSLRFPAVDRKRTAKQFDANALLPGTLNRAASDCTKKWCSSKVRLGIILHRTLELNPDIFRGGYTHVEKMHCFEAALFMIGYNPAALLRSSQSSPTALRTERA